MEVRASTVTIKLTALLFIVFVLGCASSSNNTNNGWRQSSPPSYRVVSQPTAKVHVVSKGDTLFSISRRYNLEVKALARANSLSPPYLLSIGDELTLNTNSSVAYTPRSQQYTIKKGDTLFAISQRYGLSYREVATANGIGYPYHLKPGQKITIPSQKPASHKVQKGESLYDIAWRYGLDYRSLAAKNNIRPPYTIYPSQVLSLEGKARISSAKPHKKQTTPKVTKAPSKPKTTVKTTKKKNSPPPVAVTVKPVSGEGWQWPAKGEVINIFKTTGKVNKGIDIAGKRGDAVRATKSGVVVYSGTGLSGYGKLLIVKHSDTYLSAYAHNDRLLVKEGDKVSRGQKIAEMGSTGANRVMLHFEIRKEGTPINPQRLLPKQ